MEGQSRTYAFYALALLTLINCLNLADRMLLAAVLEQVKLEFSLLDWHLGLINGFGFAAFYALAGIPLGRLADIVPRNHMIIACLGFFSLMTAMCGVAASLWQLILARVCVGAGEAGCTPASHSMVADYFAPASRSFALAIVTMGGPLGVLLGLAGGGMVAEAYGWRMAFIGFGAIGLVVTVLMALTLYEPSRGRFLASPAPAAAPLGFVPVLRTLAAKPTYLLTVLGYTFAMFMLYGLTQWAPTFLIRSHGLSTGQAGAYFGLMIGAGTAVAVLTGGSMATWLVRRDARWAGWFPAASYGLAVLFLSPGLVVPVLDTALILLLAGAACGALPLGVVLATVQNVCAPSMRATAVAVMLLVSSLLGMGMGPFLIGLLSDALYAAHGLQSLRWSMALLMGMGLFAALSFWASARHMEADIIDER